MNIDDLLFAIIIAGIGFSGIYLRAELLLHRRMTAIRRRRELVQLELHAKRVRVGQKDLLGQPRAVPSLGHANISRVMRDLARALRIFIQARNIHRFRIRT
jgi:hypothetical protein